MKVSRRGGKDHVLYEGDKDKELVDKAIQNWFNLKEVLTKKEKENKENVS